MSRATTARAGQNVTPKGMPKLAYVGCVEISPHDPDTIYRRGDALQARRLQALPVPQQRRRQELEVDQRRLARRARSPASCAPIPCGQGLLYVGTETGVFFSLDDGAHWIAHGGRLSRSSRSTTSSSRTPTSWPATHGRSFWILDDVTALREPRQGRPEAATRSSRRATTIRTKLHWSAGAERAQRHRLRARLRHRRQHR